MIEVQNHTASRILLDEGSHVLAPKTTVSLPVADATAKQNRALLNDLWRLGRVGVAGKTAYDPDFLAQERRKASREG